MPAIPRLMLYEEALVLAAGGIAQSVAFDRRTPGDEKYEAREREERSHASPLHGPPHTASGSRRASARVHCRPGRAPVSANPNAAGTRRPVIVLDASCVVEVLLLEIPQVVRRLVALREVSEDRAVLALGMLERLALRRWSHGPLRRRARQPSGGDRPRACRAGAPSCIVLPLSPPFRRTGNDGVEHGQCHKDERLLSAGRIIRLAF
jgi:hypothetical protein